MSRLRHFSLPSITCASCVEGVCSLIAHNPALQIDNYSIDIVEQELLVQFSTDNPNECAQLERQLIDVLDDGGFPCVVERSHTLYAGLGIGAGVSLLILSMTGIGLPFAAMLALSIASAGLTLFLGKNSFYRAWTKWKSSRQLTMDTLFTISTFSLLIVSVAAFFVPWLPMMFEAGLLIFGFRHLGLAIRDSLKSKMEFKQKFQDRAPKKVQVLLSDGTVVDKDLGEVLVGEILLIDPKSGDAVIPLDGICLTDNTAVNQLLLTGQDSLRPLSCADRLLAGMVIPKNYPFMQLQVTATQSESYLARLDESLMRATFEKAPIQAYADKALQYFIPTILGLAVLSGLLVGVFFPPALAIQCAASVLVSACPCTLGFIVPLAMKIGIFKAKNHGVQFKNASVLETADDIDAVVFDLNGTLTEGKPRVVSGRVTEGCPLSFSELLNLAANLELKSSHPFAKAILEHAEQTLASITPIAFSPDSHQKMASGVLGAVDEETWVLGNARMMSDYGIDTQDINRSIQVNPTESLIYIAKNKKIMGFFVISDPLRLHARETVTALKALGKKVYMCTGADQQAAFRYADALNISHDHVYADRVALKTNQRLLDKSDCIQALKAQNFKVAMVGDAGNDAAAIASSDLGIVIQSKSSDIVTQENAGVLLQNGSLDPVSNTFVIARQTMRQIKQNLWFSLGYNTTSLLLAGGLLVGVGFVLNPGVGVAMMILQTCLILANAYRLKVQKINPIQTTSSPLSFLARDGSQAARTMALSMTHEPTSRSDHRTVPKLPNERPSGYQLLYQDELEQERGIPTC